MSVSGAYVAEMLRVSARGYAAHAAEQLLEQHPECARRFGAAAFRNWQDNLAQRLNELAISLELDEPSLFTSQLQWSREAFAAREVPVEHLQQSLESLRETLRQDLPDGSGDYPAEVIERALTDLREREGRRPRLLPDTDESHLALAYVEAVLAGERRRAIRMVVDAVAGGLPIEHAYERVLLPAQAEIGTMWHLCEISVAEEHAATETTRTVMSVLAHRMPVNGNAGKVVMVASVEGDRHDIGVRAVADLAELAELRAILLGSDVPASELARAVDDFEPDILILAASLSQHLGQLRSCIRAVRDFSARGEDLKIIVGGPAFGESGHLAERLGADAFAESPSAAVRLARELAGSAAS